MLEPKKAFLKIKPLIVNLSKKSRIASKKLVHIAKKGNLDKRKIKKILNLLDESKASKKWVRSALIGIIILLIAKKAAESYDESKTFKQNMKKLVSWLKKIKNKRIKLND